MRINPSAVVFWIMAGLIGHLIGGNGAVIGVLIAMTISLLLSFI